jgi:hypothetical protein
VYETASSHHRKKYKQVVEPEAPRPFCATSQAEIIEIYRPYCEDRKLIFQAFCKSLVDISEILVQISDLGAA